MTMMMTVTPAVTNVSIVLGYFLHVTVPVDSYICTIIVISAATDQ